MKLRCAGLAEPAFPLASASDARSREAIVRLAAERVVRLRQAPAFRSVVCVGDGVWDVRTARRLGYHFVGVASGQQAARLRQEGAAHLIADFTDRARFFEAIQAGG